MAGARALQRSESLRSPPWPEAAGRRAIHRRISWRARFLGSRGGSPWQTSFSAEPATLICCWARGGRPRRSPSPLSPAVGLNLSRVRPITANKTRGEYGHLEGVTAYSKRSVELGLQRIAHLLGLVFVGVLLVSGRATALVTDFDLAAGYLRDGQYGKLYAKLTEQDRTHSRESSDSSLGPIGRNRPGRARLSGRRLSAPAPSLPSPVR